MWDRYDPRSAEGRDRGGSYDRNRGSRGGSGNWERDDDQHRDVFTKALDLPRGHCRELVRDRDRVYEINGFEGRTLATVGAFRVVAESALNDSREQQSSRETLKHLERERLIQTAPLNSGDRAVTLTARGRELLEANRDTRHDRSHEPRQAFYSGLTKPRELTHDTNVYRAYQRAEECIHEQGGQVRRVVLDYELKRDYQRFLQEPNRGCKNSDGRPHREPRRSLAGRVNTSCRTTTIKCTFPTLESSTRTVTDAHVMRISRS